MMTQVEEAGFPFEKGTKRSDPWPIKIQRMDSKLWAGIIYILIIIVLITPLNIPVAVEPFVLEVATWIDSLQPGDVVFFHQTYPVGSIADYGAMWTSVILHCMLKSSRLKKLGIDVDGDGKPDGLKMIMAPYTIDGQIQFDWNLKRIAAYVPDNLVYGDDYVVWPYLVGNAALYMSLSVPGTFEKLYTKDLYTGKAWTDLAVTKNVHSPADFDMMFTSEITMCQLWAQYAETPIDHGGVPFVFTPEKWTKQSQSGRRRPHAAAYPIQIWDSAAEAVEMPYYTSGQHGGFLTGCRSGGEYEFYISQNYHIKDDPKLPMIPTNTGFGQRTLDSMNLAQTFTFGMMILGNLGYWVQRRRTKGGPK